MKLYKFIFIIIFFICCTKTEKSTPKNTSIEQQVETILANMSLEDKIGQTNLRGTSSRTKVLPEQLKKDVRNGKVGALLNVMNVDFVDELQKIAVEESPNKIPLIFARDVIHGFKTIFPIPLAQAASWDTNLVEKGSRIAAIEASSVGIRWTFAPMLDIARDSRWGRVAESPGEDPYLASILGAAYVKGFQGDSLQNPTSIAACAKHYIGYGAAEGGRDYNTAVINEALLRNVYLPPFKAALDAGSATVMSSFNEVNGEPVTGSKFLLKEILREEMQFDGLVVSDWDSVTELIAHGFAEDKSNAAELALNAGLDMEMNSNAYELHTKNLIAEGKFSETELDILVKNILRTKIRLGLFKNPYRDKNNEANFYNKEHLVAAKNAAVKSTVLLKNNNVLPISNQTKVALIGPMANAPHDQLGTWTFDGDKEKTITPLMAFNKADVKFTYVEGLTHSRDQSKKQFDKAIAAAKKSDVVVFVAGEEAILSGEAHSRANIDLPGAQEALIKALAKTKKPIILVIMAGRPITLTTILEDVDAIVMNWHPGTMGGPALQEIIYGVQEPQGRLPISWPKTAGQLPFYYNHKNTGRPANDKDYVAMYDIPIGSWQSSLGNDSHYLDIGFRPQFPFGYGLGYTTYKYNDLKLSTSEITKNATLEVSVSITNTGKRQGKEIVQLYIQDKVASITRPVKELKKFEHVVLNAGETKKVSFSITIDDLKFTNNQNIYAAENGDFNIWIGPNAAEGIQGEFTLKK